MTRPLAAVAALGPRPARAKARQAVSAAVPLRLVVACRGHGWATLATVTVTA